MVYAVDHMRYLSASPRHTVGHHADLYILWTTCLNFKRLGPKLQSIEASTDWGATARSVQSVCFLAMHVQPPPLSAIACIVLIFAFQKLLEDRDGADIGKRSISPS